MLRYYCARTFRSNCFGAIEIGLRIDRRRQQAEAIHYVDLCGVIETVAAILAGDAFIEGIERVRHRRDIDRGTGER